MYLDSFCRRAAKTLPSYKEPVDYLHRRGFNDEEIARYGLGYVRAAKVEDDGSNEYGAFHKLTNRLRYLEGRVLFPIRNVLGHANGVVARDINEKRYCLYFLEEAKKIGAFFGIHEALPHIKRTKKVFIHEGAIDAMSFAMAFPNSSSSLTSFINTRQYEVLRFFADLIILVYDKDKAGFTGMRDIIKQHGSDHIETLCIGDDDSNQYLQVMGREKWIRYVRSKVPPTLRD